MTDYLTNKYDLDNPNIVSVYDELSLWSAMFGGILLRHVQLRANSTVLDVGCGIGFPLLELAQRLGSSCQVYGIDPWGAALNRVTHKINTLNIQNVEVIKGDAVDMPFKNDVIDLIVSNVGVNNFENPEMCIRECWRVAKPFAQIALTTNLQGHMKEFYEVFHLTLKECCEPKKLDDLQDHIHHRSTVEGIRGMLEKAGFSIRTVHKEAFPMRFLDGSAMLRHSFTKVAFLDGWRSFLTPEEEMKVFPKLERNLNDLAEKKGELELTIPMAYIEGEKSVK
ncbi:MAG: methyltransferase domain-containing protein [bacterium]